ncbi:hypothetical protein ABT040_37300, partial [Streptomyces sp. NPDC002688]|uniref:hypothetical protein n=1 Tax=Streptomyces sp. NPDC002688 TaxID=3154423 RepID=UPI003317F1AD
GGGVPPPDRRRGQCCPGRNAVRPAFHEFALRPSRARAYSTTLPGSSPPSLRSRAAGTRTALPA